MINKNYFEVKNAFEFIKKDISLVTIIACPYMYRSGLERQIVNDELATDSQLRWLVIDLPAEEDLEISLSGANWWKKTRVESFEKEIEKLIQAKKKIIFVINSLDSVGDGISRQNFKRLVTLKTRYRQEIGIVLGQGCEEVVDSQSLLFEYYGCYLKNRFWLSMYDSNDFDEVVRKRYKANLISDKQIRQAYKMCGGYFAIGEILVSDLSLVDNIDKCLQDERICFLLETLWQCCSKESQNILKNLVLGKKVNPTQYLLKTGMVSCESMIFSLLMERWIKELVSKEDFSLKEINGVLWLAEENLEDRLTYQEYQVLDWLWAKKGEEVSRDEVAKVMWGEKSNQSYSDWAIDKIISKIRKKIGDVGKKKKLKSIKGKGFILSLE